MTCDFVCTIYPFNIELLQQIFFFVSFYSSVKRNWSVQRLERWTFTTIMVQNRSHLLLVVIIFMWKHMKLNSTYKRPLKFVYSFRTFILIGNEVIKQKIFYFGFLHIDVYIRFEIFNVTTNVPRKIIILFFVGFMCCYLFTSVTICLYNVLW